MLIVKNTKLSTRMDAWVPKYVNDLQKTLNIRKVYIYDFVRIISCSNITAVLWQMSVNEYQNILSVNACMNITV